jgi:diguanylate cyclase (GGDEF)-like protein
VNASGSWAAQQLAELLATVSSYEDEESAERGAVERAAEALEAEAGALVEDGVVVHSVGFPSGAVPDAELLRAAGERSSELDVPGVGRCATLSAPLEGSPDRRLILVRAGDDGFSREEEHLVRGMGRVLSLVTGMLRLLENERTLRGHSQRQAEENAYLLASLSERQALLERLSSIQRSIVQRADLQELLDSVVEGARELIGDEVVGLRLVDPEDPTQMVLVAHVGLGELAPELKRSPIGEGAGGRAIAERQLVTIHDYSNDPNALKAMAEQGLESAMAAPVLENGEQRGSLVVASRRPGRVYSDSEQEVLKAFAEHASIALTDSRNFAKTMYQATHDSLTDLPNRELFLDRLNLTLRRTERRSETAAVLFVDLDGFKSVNDSLGHDVGDQLLVTVARRLESALHAEDTAARLGGDEFSVLLEGVPDAAAAAGVAERLREVIAAPVEIRGHELAVTASIGIATAHGPGRDLLRDADLAMYQAKSAGKDRSETFRSSMHTAVVERLAMEADLGRAVERDELKLDFQPIVSLGTGKIAGVEALVRWHHPERGLVSPADFIPLAEETRAIASIGQWVLREACRQALAWQHLHPSLAMSVNLSSVQLDDPRFNAQLAATLTETGLEPRSLILEITENVLMRDVEATRTALDEIKKLGVQLAVDDFGTGYSSLQYLRGFPIDILKIDKSFIEGVSGASDESALARAIIDLGDSFQLRVVAEGIERREQLDKLRKLGCDLGQGFYFARPMDAQAFETMLGGGVLPEVTPLRAAS